MVDVLMKKTIHDDASAMTDLWLKFVQVQAQKQLGQGKRTNMAMGKKKPILTVGKKQDANCSNYFADIALQ